MSDIARKSVGAAAYSGDASKQRLSHAASLGTGGKTETGAWVHPAGRTIIGSKIINFSFFRNVSQIAIFMVVPTFWSINYMTGESGVRGKTDPNWLRKVFNRLRSL
jgi:hypothetical protein